MMHSKFFKTLSVFLISSFFAGQVMAQETNEAALKTILSGKNFVFKAQSAWPLQGRVIQLTPGFDMKVLTDSINTYLPYFGRAYTAEYAQGGGINFTSSKFEYKLKEKSKGGWELLIKPSDTKDVTQLNYSVSTNGFATLQVISNNRQAISFYGVIEKTK
ncbi:MAG TPA: DUF4251 domain-containing protein [Flavisolibacter sp.]|nr:DUF4251 domain-containing protein [Flavisolibacter sp.]